MGKQKKILTIEQKTTFAKNCYGLSLKKFPRGKNFALPAKLGIRISLEYAKSSLPLVLKGLIDNFLAL